MTKMKSGYHYTECGLDYIYLTSGVEHKEYDGEEFYKIPEMDALHDIIAQSIVLSSSPLRGMELRFLRTLMGKSQESLSVCVGRKRNAIATAEAEPHKVIGGQLDRLMRHFYVAKNHLPDEMAKLSDLMDDIAEEAYQKEIGLDYHDGWSMHDKACA